MKYFLAALTAITCAVLITGCSRPEHSTEILRQQGYTNINILGYAFFGCGKDDTFHDEFTATAPNGVRVHGVVCSDYFKGATVRFL